MAFIFSADMLSIRMFAVRNMINGIAALQAEQFMYVKIFPAGLMGLLHIFR